MKQYTQHKLQTSTLNKTDHAGSKLKEKATSGSSIPHIKTLKVIRSGIRKAVPAAVAFAQTAAKFVEVMKQIDSSVEQSIANSKGQEVDIQRRSDVHTQDSMGL